MFELPVVLYRSDCPGVEGLVREWTALAARFGRRQILRGTAAILDGSNRKGGAPSKRSRSIQAKATRTSCLDGFIEAARN
jgi:hypothetical protein